MFGEDFAQQDQEELSGLVSFAASADSGWLAENHWLASHVDNMANKAGAKSYTSATPELRETVMLNIMVATSRLL